MAKLSKYQKDLVNDLAFDAYQNRGEYEDELSTESIEKWVLEKYPTDTLAQQEYLRRNSAMYADVVQLRKKSKSSKPKRKPVKCSCKKARK